VENLCLAVALLVGLDEVVSEQVEARVLEACVDMVLSREDAGRAICEAAAVKPGWSCAISERNMLWYEQDARPTLRRFIFIECSHDQRVWIASSGKVGKIPHPFDLAALRSLRRNFIAKLKDF
jgi:hypothetical protein